MHTNEKEVGGSHRRAERGAGSRHKNAACLSLGRCCLSHLFAQCIPPELKVRTPAHTKHMGWYLEFESRVKTHRVELRRVPDREALLPGSRAVPADDGDGLAGGRGGEKAAPKR